ncbi:hypothetical protein M8J77_014813, partial [Diaphorina citri]
VTITGFDLDSYRQCLKKWNEAISIMYQKCLRVGPSRCMVVYYEQLVLHPEKWLRRILQFFDLGWNSSVLHHEEMINKPGGVFLSNSLNKVLKSKTNIAQNSPLSRCMTLCNILANPPFNIDVLNESPASIKSKLPSLHQVADS